MNFRLKLSELRNLTWKTLKNRSKQLSVAQNEILCPARSKKFSILRCYGAPKDTFRRVLSFQLFPNASGMHRLSFVTPITKFTDHDRRAYPQ